VRYWMDAWDTQAEPRHGYWPAAGKYDAKKFTAREKVNNVLFVYGDDNADIFVYMDMFATLGVDYDDWCVPNPWWLTPYTGFEGGKGAPPTSVINAGYDAIIWATLGGIALERTVREGSLDDYLDGGGKFFLSGQDALAGIYGYDSVGTETGEFAHDYLKFNWVFDDAVEGKDPIYLYGAEGDTIGGPFSVDLLWYDPMNTWSEQDIWIGSCGTDDAIEIFYTEADVPCGYRYESGKGYKYAFLYYQLGAIRDEFAPDTVVNMAQVNEIMTRTFSWFGIPIIGVDIKPTNIFALSQNTPNPVSSGTTISFSIPQRSEVSLRVYNIAGQCVKTLLSNEMDRGVHNVSWNGRNESGKRVASGVYFYRLEAGDNTATRKMVVLK